MSKLIKQKTWELQKLIVLIQLVVTPIATVLILVYRGIETVPAESILIISQNLIGMFICALLFISCVKDRQNHSLRTACFARLIDITALQMFLSSLVHLLQSSGKWAVICLIAETLLQVNAVILTVTFLTYLRELSAADDQHMTNAQTMVYAGAALVILLLLGNLFGHYFFYIDAGGTFVKLKLRYLLSLYPIIASGVCILLILGMDASASQKRVLTTFVTLPVSAIVVYALGGISLVYPALLCSLIFIYGNVFTMQEAELTKANLEMIQKENELLKIRNDRIRVETELNLASQIQSHILPMIFPPFPQYDAFELYAAMLPAREVGGDFYDFFLIDKDHIGLVVADVSGKGVPAALYMMVAKTMIKNAAMQGHSPAWVLTQVNHQLCESGSEIEMFVTVWYGVYEISTGRLTAANGGHEHPVLRLPNGEFELYKEKHSFVLGGMDGVIYREHELLLPPGSALFIYSDGVTEATDPREQLFGTDRLLKALNREKDADAARLLENVHNDILDFTEDAAQFDDITMLALIVHSTDNNMLG